jgi:hypothetical protein
MVMGKLEDAGGSTIAEEASGFSKRKLKEKRR